MSREILTTSAVFAGGLFVATLIGEASAFGGEEVAHFVNGSMLENIPVVPERDFQGDLEGADDIGYIGTCDHSSIVIEDNKFFPDDIDDPAIRGILAKALGVGDGGLEERLESLTPDEVDMLSKIYPCHVPSA